ncbi:MAG: aminopeptidase P family protein [Dehalococcoidia bacterium]|nr:aminopeptidase P family protein [Dehalococcoidia bacterium]
MNRETYLRRIWRMQGELKKQGVDIALFADRNNLIYFTGITDFECMSIVIPVEGEPHIVSLWLDAEFVRSRVPCEHVVGYPFPATNLGARTVEVIKSMGYESPRIGFGKYFVEFSVYDALRTGLPKAEFVSIATAGYVVRSVKDADEIARMRRAGSIVVEGMRAAFETVRPGLKEVEVVAEAEHAMRKAGSQGAPFRMQVLVPERQLLTHPYAGETVIGNNQAIVIHLGATFEGYVAKMCRTIGLGSVNLETEHIYDVLLETRLAAMAAVKPPLPARDVYKAAYDVVEAAGYGREFLEVIGYGVGIRQSEFYPIISKTGDHVIEKDMVIDILLSTIYKKGVGGPRVTDTILVTDGGVEVLTDFPVEMVHK